MTLTITDYRKLMRKKPMKANTRKYIEARDAYYDSERKLSQPLYIDTKNNPNYVTGYAREDLEKLCKRLGKRVAILGKKVTLEEFISHLESDECCDWEEFSEHYKYL